MSALFLELARAASPHTFRLRIIFSIVVLAPLVEVAKSLPVGRLDTQKLIVSVSTVLGVELLATTLATVLPNFVLTKHLQKLESFVRDIIQG